MRPIPELLALLATAAFAIGCGEGASDPLEQARESIEAATELTEDAVKDEQITAAEAREICQTAAAKIPDRSAAEDAVEICVEATLDSQKILREVDTDALEDQIKGSEDPLPR